MSIEFRSPINQKSVKITTGQVLEIKDLILKVTSMDMMAKTFTLEEASQDEIRIHLQTTHPHNVSAPKLEPKA